MWKEWAAGSRPPPPSQGDDLRCSQGQRQVWGLGGAVCAACPPQRPGCCLHVGSVALYPRLLVNLSQQRKAFAPGLAGFQQLPLLLSLKVAICELSSRGSWGRLQLCSLND